MRKKSIYARIKSALGKGPKPRDQLLELLPGQAVCAEIGVWKGRFSRQIHERLSPSMLHLIDPWAFQPSFENRMYGGRVARNQADMDAIFTAVSEHFASENNVTITRKYSADAAGDFADEYFDWVYIDGNHHYDYVLEDLENYFPKVKCNGFLAGDDYLWSPREADGDLQVKRAVTDFIASRAGQVEVTAVFEDQFALKKLV